VAAFAHTFGGLLIVGVTENTETQGQPDAIVGVDMAGELKTRIASSIATNISPPPTYQIGECTVPHDPHRRVAVIRVPQSDRLHYCTRKGGLPIYVRNEDQTIPADAARLRSLIERTAAAPQADLEIASRMTSLTNSVVLRRTAELERESGIPTSRQIVLIPRGHPHIGLDSAVEQQFRGLINRTFSFRHPETEAEREEQRWVDWYEWRWFRPTDRHESVWRITCHGDLVYRTQARVRVANKTNFFWSLGDTLVDILLMLTVVRSFWKSWGFFGEAQLIVNLHVNDLPLYPDLATEVWTQSNVDLFQARQDFNASLRDSIVSLNPSSSGMSGGAVGTINSGLPVDAAADTVANIMNQLLRCLQHGADLSSLRRAVEIFFRASAGAG